MKYLLAEMKENNKKRVRPQPQKTFRMWYVLVQTEIKDKQQNEWKTKNRQNTHSESEATFRKKDEVPTGRNEGKQQKERERERWMQRVDASLLVAF